MSGIALHKLATGLLGLATVVYPFAIYLSVGRVEPWQLAALLVALSLVRLWASRDSMWLAAAACAAALALAGMLSHSLLPFKLYPVLVNAALLAIFGTSLAKPPTLIERLARLSEPDLSPAAVAYTRKVTQVWCVFFALNGTAALGTALWASSAGWAMYNGLVAYVLMGTLFAGEWLVRQRVKARARCEAAHV